MGAKTKTKTQAKKDKNKMFVDIFFPKKTKQKTICLEPLLLCPSLGKIETLTTQDFQLQVWILSLAI